MNISYEAVRNNQTLDKFLKEDTVEEEPEIMD
jgi:hypothetical protein